MSPKVQKVSAVCRRYAVVLVFFGLFLCTSTVSLYLSGNKAAATTSGTINFQARLMTGAGSIAPDGNYNVEFKLYDALTSSGSSQGSCTGDAHCLWTETRTSGNVVHVANGYLTVNLGSVNPFPTINWNQQIWLTMNIGGTGSPTWDGEMTPRLQLTAVPYAFAANTLVATNGSDTSVLKFGTPPTGGQTITLPNVASGTTATVCYQADVACGFLTGTASSYIQNGTTVQTAANFNIRSVATGSVTGVLQGASGQSVDMFDVQTWNGTTATTVFGVSNVGDLAVQNVNLAANKTITFAAGSGGFDQHSSTGTFQTGTGNVSLNGATAVTGSNTFTVAGGLSSLTGATTGDALNVSNSTSTGNIAVFKDNATAVLTIANEGGVALQNTTNSAGALTLQNAAGHLLFSVDTTANASNLITNPSFETNTTGWNQRTSCTLTASASQQYFGNNSGACANTATGAGMNYPVQLSNNTAYSLTFYARSSSAITSNFAFGYAEDGSTENLAGESSLSQSVSNSGWTRYVLAFTTGPSVNAGAYFFMKQTDSTSRSLYVDAVDLEQAANQLYSPYREGKVQINGVVTTPLALQNTTDSTTAFQIVNAAGGSQVLTVDSLNKRVTIGSVATNASSVTNAKLTVLSSGANPSIALKINQNDTSTAGADIADFQLSGTAVFSITNLNGGQAIFENTANSTGAFQVQNQSGDADLNFDTSNNKLTVGNVTATAGHGLQGSVVFGDGSNSNFGITVQAALNSITGSSKTITLPNETGTVCTSAASSNANCTNFAAATGGTGYIQNQAAAAQAANYFIRSAATGSVGAVIQGASGQTVDILDVQTWNGTTATTVLKVDNTGLTTISGGLTGTGAVLLNNSGSATTGIGSSTAGAVTIASGAASSLAVTGSTLALSGTNFSLNTSGVLSLLGGQVNGDIITPASGTTATALKLQPGTSGASTTTGAGVTLKGGGVSGTTTVTGGAVTIQGGDTSGISGTRNGGNVSIDGGSGASANGTVSLGTGTTSGVSIGNTSASVSIEASNAGLIAIGNGNTAHTIQIGTGGTSTAQAVTIGSAPNIASALSLQAGTGASAITLTTGVASGTAGGIQIGNTSGANSQTINLGTNATASSTNILHIGDAANATDTITIGSPSNSASSLALESGTGTTSLFNGGTAHTIQLATGAAIQSVTIGSTNSTSSLSLQAGTGNLNIGNDNAAKTTTINIGNDNTGADIIALGSTNASSTTSIQGGTTTSGSGAISIQASGTGLITLGSATNVITIGGVTTLTTLGTTNTSSFLCRNAANQIAGCSTGGAGAAYVQGGNAFGTLSGNVAILGTTDANDLEIVTGSSSNVRAYFDRSNDLYLGNGVTAAAPNDFSVLGTGSTTAGTAGGKLTIQGGAGTATGAGSVGGAVAIKGGDAGAGSGNLAGGAVSLQGGTAVNTGQGGTLNLNGGNATTTGTDGTVNLDSGSGATTANGTVNLGITNTSAINIGTGAQARTILIGSNGAAGTVAQTINIGTNSSAGATNAITIGNSTATASTVAINGGTTTAGNGGLSLQAGSGGLVTIGTVNAGTVSIGAIGSTANASTIHIADTTGNATQVITIGASAAGGANSVNNTLTLDAGTASNAIQIGNSAQAHGIQIGSGAAVQTILLGSTTTSSTTTIEGGATGAPGIAIGNGTTNHSIAIGTNTTGNQAVTIGALTGNASDLTTIQGGNLSTGTGAVSIQAASGGLITLGTTNSNPVTVGGASSTVTLGGASSSVKVGAVGASTANSATLCRDTSTNVLTSCDGTNTTGKAYLQGGNAFGTLSGNVAVLGTTDANDLEIVTGGSSSVRAYFDRSNNLYLGNGVSAAAPNDFVVSGTASTTAATAGGKLTIQGGAGTATGAGSVGGAVSIKGGNAGAGSGNLAGGDVSLQGGTAVNTGQGGTLNLNGGNAATGGTDGTVTLDSGSGATTANGTVNLGIANTSTINLGTGAQGRTINIGYTGSVTSVTQTINLGTTTVAGGTSNINVGSTAATASVTTISGGTNATTGALILQVGSAGFLNVGNTAATKTVNIGSTGSTAGNSTVNIATSSANTQAVAIGSNGVAGNVVDIDSGSNAAGIEIGNTATTHDIQIGTNATGNQTVTIGATANSSDIVKLQGGSAAAGGIQLNAPVVALTAANPTVTASGTNTLTLKTADSTTVATAAVTLQSGSATVGTNLAAGTVTIDTGTTTGSGAAILNLGNNNAKTIQIGNVNAAVTVEGSSAATGIQIGNSAQTHGIKIGTDGTTTQTVVLGSTGTSSVTTIQGGATGTGLSLTTGTTGAIAIDSGTTGSILIGGGTGSAKTISLGPTATNTNTTTYNFGINAAGTQAINIGSGTTNTAANGTTVLIQGGNTATAVQVQALAAGTIGIGTNNAANTIQIGSGSLSSGTQSIYVGTSATGNTSGGTVNLTLGSGSAATAGTTTLQAKGTITLATNGTTRATFDSATNAVAFGNGLTAATPNSFTIQGTGSTTTAVAGGSLTIQGGAATVGTANGGNVTLAGGAGFGGGFAGLVVLNTPTFSTAATQTCGSNCNITQTNIDGNGAVVINATAASLSVTLSDPSLGAAAVGRVIYVTAANGSNDFTLLVNGGGTGNQIAMRQNTTATMIWNGADWTAAGASSSTTLQAAYDNTLTSAGGAELVVANGTNANGLTIRDSSTSPINGTLLEVQSATAAQLFSVSDNVTDYSSDGGAETAGGSSSTFPSNTWSVIGAGPAVSRYTTAGSNIATGAASVSVVTNTTASTGVADVLVVGGTPTALTSNQFYNVSFAVRLATGGTFTDLQVDYSKDGTNTSSVACTSGVVVKTSVWTKVNCSFQASASGITSSNAILIRQTTGVSHTFYVDDFSVTLAGDHNYATDGGADDNTNFGTNWTAVTGTGATVSAIRSTTNGNDTSDSAEAHITVGGSGGNNGIRNKLSINPLATTPGTLYRISVYASSSTSMTDFTVRYSRDGGTNFDNCVDYSSQSLSGTITSFKQITCYITPSSTAPTNPYVYFTESGTGVRDIYVDTFSMSISGSTAPSVQVGGGVNGGPVTLFTLDRAAAAPIAANNDAYLGSMYYDTTLGKLQCYESDGWGACGSSPDVIVTLSPEYTNAVLHGTGIGTMTSDICSDFLSINTSVCGTNETFNFYKWTSPQATGQTYSIYVTYQLPSTFKSFSSGSTSLMGRTDSTNSTVAYSVYKNHAGSALALCGSATVSTGVQTSWQVKVATGTADPSTCSFAASDSIVFKIDMTASSNANAYVSNLGFTFSNK